MVHIQSTSVRYRDLQKMSEYSWCPLLGLQRTPIVRIILVRILDNGQYRYLLFDPMAIVFDTVDLYTGPMVDNI